jgi:Putative auto-transporter adhesin, head GIN domain
MSYFKVNIALCIKNNFMKKIIASLLVLCLVLFATAQKEIVNDPHASIRSIDGSFNSIKISGGIDLFLSPSDNEAVAVSASDEKYKEFIVTVVEGNTLRVFYNGTKGWNKDKKNLRVYVAFKNLESVQASAACDVQVAGIIKVPSLLLTLSGACDFKGAVNVTDLKMSLSGASDIKIKGVATNVHVESSGASDVTGFDLVTDFCTAKASGASDINITVNKELTASASGASDISYKGNAVIKDMRANGASSVSKKS